MEEWAFLIWILDKKRRSFFVKKLTLFIHLFIIIIIIIIIKIIKRKSTYDLFWI
jgi:hypothetical protein